MRRFGPLLMLCLRAGNSRGRGVRDLSDCVAECDDICRWEERGTLNIRCDTRVLECEVMNHGVIWIRVTRRTASSTRTLQTG